MTIGVLHERGLSNRAIARQLGVYEHAVRYLTRMASGAQDRRGDRPRSVEPWVPAIAHWMTVAAERGVNLVALDAWLRAEHGYAGSYKAVQRFVRAKYPKPRLRVRRRVETPPGAQAQTEWAEFPRVRVAGERVALHAFHLVLSHSRAEAVVWSERADQLGWLAVHNAGLRRRRRGCADVLGERRIAKAWALRAHRHEGLRALRNDVAPRRCGPEALGCREADRGEPLRVRGPRSPSDAE